MLLDWIDGSPIEEIEKKYTVTPFQAVEAGNITGTADATRFYLRSAYAIASIVLIDRAPTSEPFEKLLRQLEMGIPAGALGLLQIPITMIRGEYLALFRENVKTVEDFKMSPVDSIRRIFGSRFEEVEKSRSQMQ